MSALEVTQQAQEVDVWGWVERSSWLVGILLGLVPAAIAVVAAMRARSGRGRSGRGNGSRAVEGNIFEDITVINQVDIVTTQQLLYQPQIIKDTSKHTPGPDGKRNENDDDTWGRIILIVVSGVAMVYLYLSYRQWALGFTAGVVLVTLFSCLITIALVFRVAGRGINVGLVLHLGAVAAASALLYHLWTRMTPYGDYSTLERLVHTNGWFTTLFIQRSATVWFVLLEIFALAYVVIAMLEINRYQIGVVAALAAARRAAQGTPRPPSWFVRKWAPESRFELFGRPLLVITVVGVGWLLSSVWSFELLQQIMNHPVKLPLAELG